MIRSPIALAAESVSAAVHPFTGVRGIIKRIRSRALDESGFVAFMVQPFEDPASGFCGTDERPPSGVWAFGSGFGQIEVGVPQFVRTRNSLFWMSFLDSVSCS